MPVVYDPRQAVDGQIATAGEFGFIPVALIVLGLLAMTYAVGIQFDVFEDSSWSSESWGSED